MTILHAILKFLGSLLASLLAMGGVVLAFLSSPVVLAVILALGIVALVSKTFRQDVVDLWKKFTGGLKGAVVGAASGAATGFKTGEATPATPAATKSVSGAPAAVLGPLQGVAVPPGIFPPGVK